jgi:hypothetical protein
MYSGIVFDYLAMATIRLTVLNSIKESDGRLPGQRIFPVGKLSFKRIA